MDSITICTVCTDDFDILNKNISYTEKNNKINIKWLVTINQYFPNKEKHLNIKSNIKFIKGFPEGEIESISLDHSIGLNKTINFISTRYAVFLDPDFFILKKNSIIDVLDYMKENDLSLFGVPWHPKWHNKYRYFPCSHCLFLDLIKIEPKNIDFRPTLVRWNRDINFIGMKQKTNPLKNLIKAIFGKSIINVISYLTYNRKSNNWDGDTCSRLYIKYFFDKNIKYEMPKPIFIIKYDWLIPLNWSLNKLIECFLSESLCYFPKKNDFIKFDNSFGIFVSSFNFESFFWKEKYFGFHIRGYPKIYRDKEDELEKINKIIQYYNKL